MYMYIHRYVVCVCHSSLYTLLQLPPIYEDECSSNVSISSPQPPSFSDITGILNLPGYIYYCCSPCIGRHMHGLGGIHKCSIFILYV